MHIFHLLWLFSPFLLVASDKADLIESYNKAMKSNDHKALDEILPIACKAEVIKFEQDMMKFRPGILYALQNPRYVELFGRKFIDRFHGRFESLMAFEDTIKKLQFPLLHQIHQALLVAYPYFIYLLQPTIGLYKFQQSEDLFFCYSLQIAFYRYIYDNIITDRNPAVKRSWPSGVFREDLLLLPEFVASEDKVGVFCKLLFDNRAKTDRSIRFALALYGYLDMTDMKALFAMAIENKEYFTATAALKSLHAKYQIHLEDNEEVKYGPPIAKLSPEHYMRCKKTAKKDSSPDFQVDLTANNADQKLVRLSSDPMFYRLLFDSLPDILETGDHPELVKIMIENFDIQAKDVLACERFAPYLRILAPHFTVKDLSVARTCGSDLLIVFIAFLKGSQDAVLIRAVNRLLPYLGQTDQLLITLRTKEIKKLL